MTFEEMIYSELKHIPEGSVTSYGDLAKRAGFPNHARHVGALLKNLPKDTRLPWHRVVNSQGKISLPDHSKSYAIQRDRLEEEGIVFINNRIHKSYFV
ncbi:MGMT family protein [Bermanella sp. R86510]|uniref:MGMT family protein n=1 Tax=unclassified Bermanella TaxID=2627862 RepID=UPI0037C6C3BC